MSELPKCKLCGADAAIHKVFGGIKYCCSSETCTMHDVLMLKNQWRTLMTQQQAEPVGIRSAIIDVLLATSTLSEGMSADAILSLFDQKPIGVISKSDAEFMERGGNGVVLYANRLADKSEVCIPVFLSPTPQAQPAPIPT